MKAILSKEAFKTELISTQLHLQKEFDMIRYMKNDNENAKEKEKENEDIYNNNNNNEDKENYEVYKNNLEQASLNFKKILHIIEH